MSLVNDIAPDVHPVVELVINVMVTGNPILGLVAVLVSVGVLNVNVPDPVPAAPVIDTTAVPLLIVPVNDQPCPVGTFDTVTSYVVALPEHIGPPTLFNVTVGNTFTFTVTVELIVFEHSGFVDDAVPVKVIVCNVTSVLVVNALVVIVAVVPDPVTVFVVVPSK